MKYKGDDVELNILLLITVIVVIGFIIYTYNKLT